MAESVREMQVAMRPPGNSTAAISGPAHPGSKPLAGAVLRYVVTPQDSHLDNRPLNPVQESSTKRIELSDEEPSMVYRMLQHLYMQSYTVDLGSDAFWYVNDSWAKSRLFVHAQMYRLGDKYQLSALKKEAARRFAKDMRISGEGKRETLTLLSVVPIVYTTTPEPDRGLRNLVAQRVFRRYKIASKCFVEELDTALEARQFARDIIALQSQKPIVDHAATAKRVYRVWQYCVRTVTRLQAIGSSFGGIRNHIVNFVRGILALLIAFLISLTLSTIILFIIGAFLHCFKLQLEELGIMSVSERCLGDWRSWAD